MFEPFLETGNIIELNNKKYLVLGIFNDEIEDSIQGEKENYVDKMLKSIKNIYQIKPSGDFLVARRSIYYYFLYYDSKTVREFLIKVFEQQNRLLFCEYSSYPENIKLERLHRVKGTRKKVGKIKEEGVKRNLVKSAFLDKSFANICTTTEVYNRLYSDVMDAKITKEQKDYLKNSMMEQLNFMAEQYDTAKSMFSPCIAEVCINNKHYLGYINFTEDHVNVFSICNKNAGLKKKVELLFDSNLPVYRVAFKDVAKVEF